MTNGLLAPLTPQQEVTLRRIALQAPSVDAAVAAQLIRLSLVARAGKGLRLTPLGELRYQALPKAPLLARQRSVHALAGYVEGIIEKAQHRAEGQTVRRPMDAVGLPCPAPEAPREDGDVSTLARFDRQQVNARACRSLEQVRRSMREHDKTHAELCAASRLRISQSRSLLQQSVPVRPRWLIALDLSAA